MYCSDGDLGVKLAGPLSSEPQAARRRRPPHVAGVARWRRAADTPCIPPCRGDFRPGSLYGKGTGPEGSGRTADLARMGALRRSRSMPPRGQPSSKVDLDPKPISPPSPFATHPEPRSPPPSTCTSPRRSPRSDGHRSLIRPSRSSPLAGAMLAVTLSSPSRISVGGSTEHFQPVQVGVGYPVAAFAVSRLTGAGTAKPLRHVDDHVQYEQPVVILMQLDDTGRHRGVADLPRRTPATLLDRLSRRCRLRPAPPSTHLMAPLRRRARKYHHDPSSRRSGRGSRCAVPPTGVRPPP